MLRRLPLLALAMLAACGTAPAVAPTPMVQTVEVEVTRVVEVEVTREVVVTATPRPATPTPRATATPAPPPLTTASATRAYSGPTDAYTVVAELPAGEPLDARSQLEGWVEIRVGGDEAWVPADAVAGDLAGVPAHRGAMVIPDGEIIQEYLADSVIFKGRVRNLGSRAAEQVTIEFELLDGSGQRLNIQLGYVDGFVVGAGDTGTFSVIMDDTPGWETYAYVLRWSE